MKDIFNTFNSRSTSTINHALGAYGTERRIYDIRTRRRHLLCMPRSGWTSASSSWDSGCGDTWQKVSVFFSMLERKISLNLSRLKMNKPSFHGPLTIKIHFKLNLCSYLVSRSLRWMLHYRHWLLVKYANFIMWLLSWPVSLFKIQMVTNQNIEKSQE